MRKKLLLSALIAVVVLCLNLALSKPAGAAGPPENHASVDVTINDAGQVTVGGVNLSALGLAPLDPQVANYAKNLGDVKVQVQDQTVTVNLKDTEVAKLLWDAASRERVATLLQTYGVQLQPAVQARVEEWISSSDINLTARYSNEASRPVELELSKPILVDVANNGQLAIEEGPLAAGIDTNVLQQIRQGGSQAVACWNKGTLTTSIDGAKLPTLVLNPAGVAMLSQALNLPINSYGTDAILNSRLGVDLSLPGGAHSASANCAE